MDLRALVQKRWLLTFAGNGDGGQKRLLFSLGLGWQILRMRRQNAYAALRHLLPLRCKWLATCKILWKAASRSEWIRKIYLSINLSTGILPPVLNSYLLQHFKRKSAVFPCFFSTKQLPANPVWARNFCSVLKFYFLCDWPVLNFFASAKNPIDKPVCIGYNTNEY